ncbi:MAG: HAMP domain-containing histidine kinase [Synechococcaceae cyanobacterium SM2_3_1]|nr:HAMP domain-containing histidine kinase [Synechococcaceae cyanobacterium SM2_3_1]
MSGVAIKKSHLDIQWIQMAALLGTILTLEYLTPVPYVFSYLYTAPILLWGDRLPRHRRLGMVGITVGLTLSNLWIPDVAAFSISNLLNRLIACVALVITGSLADINQQRQQAILQQQTQLQAAERLAELREDFDATLSHDLKTPLLGSLETLSLLLQETFGSLTLSQRQVMEVMLRSQQAMLQLVETLVDVYRIDSEGLQLNLETVDLFALAADVAASLTDLASNRRVTIRINSLNSEFRNSLLILGDGLQLRRVLVNLLSNAIHHSPRGGRVEVKLGSDGSGCLVQVIDQGPGIPAQELPHLFERFYQGESQRQTTGTGLGLYLSRQIITAHQGSIGAENCPHGGALFSFRIPFFHNRK